MFDFEDDLMDVMMGARDYFRLLSIKKKSVPLFAVYWVLLKFSKISEKLYFLSPKFEFLIFGRLMTVFERASAAIAQSWAKWERTN